MDFLVILIVRFLDEQVLDVCALLPVVQPLNEQMSSAFVFMVLETEFQNLIGPVSVV